MCVGVIEADALVTVGEADSVFDGEAVSVADTDADSDAEAEADSDAVTDTVTEADSVADMDTRDELSEQVATTSKRLQHAQSAVQEAMEELRCEAADLDE